MAVTAQVILVVDDDSDFLRATEAILVRGGYSTLPASGALEALEKSRGYAGHIALLLTDVSMPDMDGTVLAEHLVNERPDTRILLMSASTAVQSRFSLLKKPFRLAQLLEQVSKTIAGPPPLSAVAGAPDSTNDSVEAALAAEVNEMLRRYLESSRDFLEITRGVPTGIPNPDGILRLQQSANSSKRAFEEYRRAQKKLDDYIKGR